MNVQDFKNLILETFNGWQKHDATLKAGALTFFTIMPLPSLALITLAILAQVYGQQQALQQLINQVSALAGPTIANLLSQILQNAQSPLTSVFGSLFSVAFAISGAVGVFSVLQKSLNVIWQIKPIPKKGLAIIGGKVVPFIFIVGLGLIVVVWTTFSSVLFSASVLALSPVLGGFAAVFLRILEVVLSFGLGTLLFAIIFKQLPDVSVQWRDVTLAAVITGVVFTILNYFFDIYLSYFQVSTLAGTAGTLMLLFLWIYVTNLFILFGAQLSKVYAETHGSHLNKHRTDQKKPPKEEIDRVEVKTELNIKVNPKNNG